MARIKRVIRYLRVDEDVDKFIIELAKKNRTTYSFEARRMLGVQMLQEKKDKK